MTKELLSKLYYHNGYLFWAETISSRAQKDSPAGTKKQNGYYEIQYKKKRYYSHRLIWEMFFGPIPKDKIIDHIDRNPSNNLINNLRCINQSINLHNTNERSTNKSGYKGISWDKKQKKWCGAISYRGKRIFRIWLDSIEDVNNILIEQRKYIK